MRSRLAALALTVLLGWSAVRASHAAPLALEINGREFYGTTYTEGSDLYVPLDVVGPLLTGQDFALEEYDVVLRRARVHYLPAGASQPVRVYVTGCARRGAAVYCPLGLLVKAVGGSVSMTPEALAVAYPPVSAAAATALHATPTPQASPSQPTIKPTPPPSTATTAFLGSPEEAIQQARLANEAVRGHKGAVRCLEIYHPLSPEPADAIPRTEVAGLKVYLAGLQPHDRVEVALWAGRDPLGRPAYSRSLEDFSDEERQGGAFFVRLPLSVEPGWHVVRLVYNRKETLEYRFVTF